MKRGLLLFAVTSMSLGLVACSPSVTYKITVNAIGEGGKKDVVVKLVDENGKLAGSGKTVRGGTVEIEAKKGAYGIYVDNLPAGYFQTADVTTGDDLAYTVNLNTELIKGEEPERGTKLYKGDVCYDYEFTMAGGLTCTLASLFETKEAVLINFWGIECGVCLTEMPYLNAYYNEMKDSKLGFICVNSYSKDTEAEILEFMSANEYSLPTTTYDSTFCRWLGVTGWPTNVIIDRNGRYAAGEAGYAPDGTTNSFHHLADRFLGASYEPSY